MLSDSEQTQGHAGEAKALTATIERSTAKQLSSLDELHPERPSPGTTTTEP
jgi:hypothetical protein